MITKFKIYELSIEHLEKKDILLYKNKDFRITINSNNHFTYNSKSISTSGIIQMADLISKNSEYLNDQDLRNVKISQKHKDIDIEYLNLYNEKIKNIKRFHTSSLNKFLNCFPSAYDENSIKLMKPINGILEIPINAYMELTFKYYPIIADAIKKSENLGDIIDRFTIIYNDLCEDLPIYVNISNYNL